MTGLEINELTRKLARIVAPDRVVADPSNLDLLAWDALSESRLHPLQSPDPKPPVCAVRPVTTAEVREIVLFANSERVALLPYGGGSGLMGGALSITPGIVLDLREMNRVLAVDPAARCARAQAGIVLESLDDRLNAQGFILGHDPWTVPVATLGGAISTNSVGYRAGVYGSMGEQVLGLEAVLPNGEILRTRAVPKTSAGLNLNALLIGGEGCFGVITEATIKIFPRPPCQVFHALSFATFEQGYLAVQELFQQRLRPALLDFGDDGTQGSGAVLYLGFEGAPEVVAAEEQLALAICERGGGSRLPEPAAQEFWRNRHVIAQRFAQNRRQRRERGRDGLYRDWIHVALPASQVLAFRSAAIDIIDRRGVHLQESGLWICPELFSMRLGLADDGKNDARRVLQETVGELLGLVQQIGGSMEYTHGVGIKLAPLMAREHGYGLEVMRRIKAAVDPNGIMNPGKLGL